jgi:hypothetical protein
LVAVPDLRGATGNKLDLSSFAKNIAPLTGENICSLEEEFRNNLSYVFCLMICTAITWKHPSKRSFLAAYENPTQQWK